MSTKASLKLGELYKVTSMNPLNHWRGVAYTSDERFYKFLHAGEYVYQHVSNMHEVKKL